MKKSLSLKLLFLCVLLVFAVPAHALMITPATTPQWTGNETSQAEINAIIAGIMDPAAEELYKSNVGGPEEGPLADSYDTEFLNTPTDPSGAIITYVGGPIVGPPAYLLVKDGAQVPAWYLFGLSDLDPEPWDGIKTLELSGFWPDQGAISHVTLYGTRQQVPEPATMLLLGSGLLGLAVLRRKLIK